MADMETTGWDRSRLGRAASFWPSVPASVPLTEPNLPFLDPTDKFPTALSAPDLGALPSPRKTPTGTGATCRKSWRRIAASSAKPAGSADFPTRDDVKFLCDPCHDALTPIPFYDEFMKARNHSTAPSA